MAGLLGRMLTGAKSAVFERGRLIYWLNIPSFRRSARRVNAKPRGEKIRVGFLLQVPNNWAVLQPVYEAALADDRVEPVVLLMPELEFFCYVKLTRVHWEKTYAFGAERFGERAVRLWDAEKKTWMLPESLELDYIFLPRPYETYLPFCWRASALRRVTRVCFVPYSSPLLDDYCLMYNTHFIRNVNLIFCEKQHSYDYVSARLKPTLRSGDQKVFNPGFPKFDDIPSGMGQESRVWPAPRRPGVLRVLWTPRWTLDARLGGTSFFRYREEMIRWAEEDAAVNLVFRPHPLALETYVREGWMTAQERDAFLARCEACPNAAVDRSSTYFDTFWSSDVLITDVSSMLMDYMLTGKPILYCPTPAGNRFSDDPSLAIRPFLEGMYVVRSMEEIRARAEAIRRGEDPLKPTREKLAAEMRRTGHIGEDIIGLLKKDYFRE